MFLLGNIFNIIRHHNKLAISSKGVVDRMDETRLKACDGLTKQSLKAKIEFSESITDCTPPRRLTRQKALSALASAGTMKQW